NAGKRGACRFNLSDNVDAVAIFLDHARYSPDLTGNAIQGLESLVSRSGVQNDTPYGYLIDIPPYGISGASTRALHMTDHAHHAPHDHGREPGADEARDPVCGMVVKADAPHRAMHHGREFLFCSASCKSRFEANPGQYLNPPDPASGTVHAPPTAPAGAKWTCPMHPEIVRDGPGACPICGMALEPMMP